MKKKIKTQTQTSLPVGCHPDIFHCMKTLNYSNSYKIRYNWDVENLK